MKSKFAIYGLFLTFIWSNNVAARDNNDDWKYSVSAGGIFAPQYRGDDEYRLNMFPNISVEYGDRFFASLAGVGYNVINNNGWRIGPVAKYDFGRDEDGSSPLGITGDDTNDLIGLGDVDGTFEIGGFVEYSIEQFTAKVELRQGINGHEGFIGEGELKYGNSVNAFGKNIYYSFGPEFVFGNDDYTSAFYGVNAAQSARSGLAQFDAEGGLVSYGFHGSIVVPATDNISVIGFAGYDKLAGDVADSTLVQQRGSEDQGIVGLLLNYNF